MIAQLKQRFNKLMYRVLVRSARRPLFYGSDFSSYPDCLREEGYFSQYGQDKWIAEYLLPEVQGGVFCDIGAHDGYTLNNTYYFEKNRGWTGLAFEPVPELYKKLQLNRSCETINGCVSDTNGTARFMVLSGYTEMLSGLIEHYHPDHLQRIDQEIERHGGSSRTIEVETFRLNDILNSRGIDHIDYMNIDVEGPEYAILQSIDFDRFDCTVIGVENNYEDYRIPLFMRSKGYSLSAIVGDEIYVRNRL